MSGLDSGLDMAIRWGLLGFQWPRVKPEFGGPDVSLGRYIELERRGAEFFDGFVFRFDNMPKLIKRAKHDLVAFETLRRLAINAVRQGEDLPPGFAAWVADFMDDKISPPRHPGKHRHANLHRDIQICIAILEAMEEQGVTVTNACNMVAKSEGMNFDAVRKIWNKKKDNIWA